MLGKDINVMALIRVVNHNFIYMGLFSKAVRASGQNLDFVIDAYMEFFRFFEHRNEFRFNYLNFDLLDIKHHVSQGTFKDMFDTFTAAGLIVPAPSLYLGNLMCVISGAVTNMGKNYDICPEPIYIYVEDSKWNG